MVRNRKDNLTPDLLSWQPPKVAVAYNPEDVRPDSPDRPARFNLTTLEPMLEAIHERLSSVTIECLPYAEFITRYDRKHTLFYLDPPYWGCENDYGKNIFDRADFERLNTVLKTLKGRFIMSINNVPEILDMFNWANIEAVETTYSVAKGDAKRVGELIVSK